MKLLLDQNISRKLVKDLTDLFPGSDHVYPLGLYTTSDEQIWNYALDNGCTIVTQDSDFNERSLLFGYPPKVIWLRTGNTSTENISKLLRDHCKDIQVFEKDATLGCLQIW